MVPFEGRNIVPILKDEKVGMCIDFRDLNKASLNNDFPLPCIDIWSITQ